MLMPTFSSPNTGIHAIVCKSCVSVALRKHFSSAQWPAVLEDHPEHQYDGSYCQRNIAQHRTAGLQGARTLPQMVIHAPPVLTLCTVCCRPALRSLLFLHFSPVLCGLAAVRTCVLCSSCNRDDQKDGQEEVPHCNRCFQVSCTVLALLSPSWPELPTEAPEISSTI